MIACMEQAPNIMQQQQAVRMMGTAVVGLLGLKVLSIKPSHKLDGQQLVVAGR